MSQYEHDRLASILESELNHAKALIAAYEADPSSEFAFDNLNDASKVLVTAARRVPTLQEMAHKLRGVAS